MDRWERRLHLMARTGAAPQGARVSASSPGSPRVIDARERLAAPPGGDPTDLIHPDEAPVVNTLLGLAENRPGFRAELSLLARNEDRWEYHRFEVVNEVMGPVIRLLDFDGEPVVEASTLDDEPGDVAEEVADEALRFDVVVERSEVIARLGEALERSTGTKVGVLLLDLDRFKLHNDLLGDDDGNRVLSIVAERLHDTAAGAFTGWMGGDEFVVVVEGLDEPSSAQALADDIRHAIAQPIEIGTEALHVTATVGLAFGDAPTEPAHLLRDADTALFAGKDRGRDRVQVFGRQLEAHVARQLSTAQRLRHALANGTLELHYQPVVSLETGMIVAAEALMRINSGRADDEPLSPASLIDAAEDSGLIARLGRYVLEETTTQIARWEERLGNGRNFRVSVNISPVQLSDRDFSGAIGHALRAARVSPKRLSLELTESILLGTSPTVDLVVQDLVDLGIAFGLDDFGSEGSSLAGLRRFPIEFLKIDRALVEAIDADERVEAIVASTVSLARQLGVSTVAVGVERESQREILRRLGCDTAQGFLFSPPLSAEDFTNQL